MISRITDLLFTEVIRKIGNHDLGLGWYSISRRSTLTTLARGTWSIFLGLLCLLCFVSRSLLVGDVCKREDLASCGGYSASSLLALFLASC